MVFLLFINSLQRLLATGNRNGIGMSHEKKEDIKRDEWKHVQWFYDNCNWRNGRARGTFAVTSTRHGAQIGGASNPCENIIQVANGGAKV